MTLTCSLLTLAVDPFPAGPGAVDVAIQVFGRLHPLLVHFSVALLPVALAVEAVRVIRERAEPGLAPTARCLVVLAGLIAVATAASGWANAHHERGDADRVWAAEGRPTGPAADDLRRLEVHRWASVAAAGGGVVLAAGVLAAGRPVTGARRTALRAGLAGLTGLVLFTGHLGGELVHGAGHVLQPLQRLAAPPSSTGSPVVPPADRPAGVVPRAPAAAAAVPPGPRIATDLAALEAGALDVFDRWCWECHGDERQDAGLQLVPLAAAFDWEPEYWTIVPRDPGASVVLQRIGLPVTNRFHMPRNGPALPPEDVAAIEAWITAGAPLEGRSPASSPDANAPAAAVSPAGGD